MPDPRHDGVKGDRVYMVVSEQRFKRWTNAAKREDRKLSQWLRLAADERAALKDIPPPDRGAETLAQGRRIHLRAAKDRKARWEAAAKREDRTLSNWLRHAGDARTRSSRAKAGRKKRRKPAKR